MTKIESRPNVVVGLTFVTFLAITILGWHYARQLSYENASTLFKTESDDLHRRIEGRFNTYEQVLRGGVGLFKSSNGVDRNEWHQYVKTLSMKSYFPGIQGIGFSKWIGSSANIATHEANIRAEGFPNYQVQPEGIRDGYTSIVYLEPFEGRNSLVLGYDMFSETNRREAMERARDTGGAALSGKVELLQETSDDRQAGFLLYLPVYENGKNVSTVETKRNALTGFVYSPFRANDLMSGILEKNFSTVSFQIYDQTPEHTDSLLYDGVSELSLHGVDHSTMFSHDRQMVIAGRQWTIVYLSTPVFERIHNSYGPIALLSIGFMLSILVSTIAWMLLSARVRIKTRNLELLQIEQANIELTEATRVAENANKAKSSFLASISHEIRTPMNGVVGMVEVLLNETPTPQQASSLLTVLDSSTKLLDIIDDVLDFSKIEAGNLDLDTAEGSLSEVIDSVICNLVPAAIKNGVILSHFISPDVPDAVWLDALRFRQILNNLVGNAIKFSKSDSKALGRVSVRVTNQPEDPTRVRFDVTDNGIGIEQAAINCIFDSFVQAESSTTRRFGGSGLGLSICQRLVTIMNGVIWVTSNPGDGSVFSVVLPLKPANSYKVPVYEDISRVKCTIVKGQNYLAENIEAYLHAADADARITDDIHTVNSIDANHSEPVVVLCSKEDRDAFEQQSNGKLDIRYVVMSRNRGRLIIRSEQRASLQSAVNSSSNLISAISIQLDGLRRRDLIESVAIAAGKASPEVLQSLEVKPIRSTVEPLSITNASIAGTLILVAEDDRINQKVLFKQLSLLGYTAEFTSNGKEALALWRKNFYAMLFTDLHMPEMDGYQLTKTIRSEEEDGERLPIIALTANALFGEVKRAEKIGVDQYLTKPIRLASLQETIECYLAPISDATDNHGALEQDIAADASNDSCVFDSSVLSGLLGSDDGDIVDFLVDYSQLLEDQQLPLSKAVRENDKQLVRQISHRLISTSLSVGAIELGELCRKLEMACDDNGMTLSANDADYLAKVLDRAKHAVSEVINAS